MSNSSLTKRLGIKPGHRVRLLKAPPGFRATLDSLPNETKVAASGDGPFDVVLLFVRNKAEVDEHAREAIGMVRPRGLLWIAYPKKSSKVKTDISRDQGWETVEENGWTGVSLISVDETWSAMRYRPREEVGT